MVVTTLAGASYFGSRTWGTGVVLRLVEAVVYWVIARIDLATSRLVLQSQLAYSFIALLPILTTLLCLLLSGTVAVLHFGDLALWAFYLLCRGLIRFLSLIHRSLHHICFCILCSTLCKHSPDRLTSTRSSDHLRLTFEPGMDAGSFVLIAREGEWDEVLLITHHEGSEWLVYSTSPDGSRFIWSLVRMTLGNFRAIDGRDQHRSAPAGIPMNSINWLCDPGDLGQKWAPSPAQLVTLCAEGRVIMDIVKADSSPPQRHIAGSRSELIELVPPVQAPAPAAASPAAGGAQARPGLGQQTQPDALELQKLADVINSLRSEIEEHQSSQKKKKKKSSKKNRSRSNSKRKSKKSKRHSSSSSSSSSRSSGTSSSSFVRWRSKGKSREVNAVSMGKVDTRKFKKRSDLLIFAAKHPGALTANFINAIRQKLMRGGIVKTSQLRDVEMTEFITTGAAGLKEVRDRREAMTILQAMDFINQKELEKAMDVLAMRVTALLEAKSQGGTWEKAAKKELIPEEGASIAPAGLTGMV